MKLEDIENGTDVDIRVIDAYIHQCTAEAQEGMSMFIYIYICMYVSLSISP